MNEFDDVSDIAWKLFVATGGVNYYLLHKKTKKDNKDERR
ncbi:MAG: YqzL family protein [Clostridia bacterium]|nr:YqzL family protein [Clostridia bacterium]